MTYNGVGSDNTIRLDVGNFSAGGNLLDSLVIEGTGVTLQVLEEVGVADSVVATVTTLLQGVGVELVGESTVGSSLRSRDILLEDDDVRVRNDVSNLGCEGSGEECESGDDESVEELHGRQDDSED